MGPVSFVALDQGSQGSKRVLVASEKGVLGSLNWKTGHLGACTRLEFLIKRGFVNLPPVQSGGRFTSLRLALSMLCCFRDQVSHTCADAKVIAHPVVANQWLSLFVMLTIRCP